MHGEIPPLINTSLWRDV